MLYELRLYHAAPGRVDDVATRMRDHIPDLFKKHGFGKPYGGWIARYGRNLPMYAYLLAWEDSAQRARAFASLYGDEAWPEVRDRTNGPREMVDGYEVLFMNAAPAWATARELHGDLCGPVSGIHELTHHPDPARSGGWNARGTGGNLLPALARCGLRHAGPVRLSYQVHVCLRLLI